MDSMHNLKMNKVIFAAEAHDVLGEDQGLEIGGGKAHQLIDHFPCLWLMFWQSSDSNPLY